jgi:2-amino-4-hydroxy-6-hydroxymethyldihydropteridine diphosphokinase
MPEAVAYIGLGSNLNHPREQVEQGIRELARLPDTVLERASSLYRSAPMGPQDQPDYVNAVVRLRTGLAPQALLDRLQAIEQRHGRRRRQHWGPRTLDLDVLLYGDCVLLTSRLRVPHPGIAQRSFVLYPLAEIASHLDIPGHGSLTGLLKRCPRGQLARLDSDAEPAGQCDEQS